MADRLWCGLVNHETRAVELVAEQRRLAGRVIIADELPDPIVTVAGVDAAFPHGGQIIRAAAVLMSFPHLEPIEHSIVEQPTGLPYIPGLLSFRELPAVRQALAGLTTRPDFVLCDGQGLAHPRRFGIACHLGLVTGLATIGVAKSRLCGRYESPGQNRGQTSELWDKGERIGQVLRTRTRVKPVFVSVGHRIGLERAVDLVLTCTPRFRLPEPIRRADRFAGQHGD